MGTPRTKAVNRYHKLHCRQFNLCLNKDTDADIIAMIDSQDNKQGYLKRLIRQDIKGGNDGTEARPAKPWSLRNRGQAR